MWKGQWKNQYGSTLTVTDESGNKITGTFRTALDDSGFAGDEQPIAGLCVGNCIHFAFYRSDASDIMASFTGLLRDGKMQTVWHVVSDSAVKPPHPGAPAERITLPWAHAVLTNSDTFERVK